MKTVAVLIPILAMTGWLTGCHSTPPPASEYVQTMSQLRYPDEAEHGPDLDIVVVRKGGAIELVNRTADIYQQMQLWLNQQYVGPVEVIEIGRPAGTNQLMLNHFINHHRETYPLGGFLTPDTGTPLVQAELYDPATGLRHRIRVQRGNN